MSDATAEAVAATVINADGMQRIASLADLRGLMAQGRYVWLDICGAPALADEAMLLEIGLNAADTAWIRRVDQAGRLAVSRHGMRAVSWLAVPHVGMIEIHVCASSKGVVTLWHGNPELLGDVRQEFVERVGGASQSHHHVALLLLQLLLGSYDQAIIFIDERLQALHERTLSDPASIECGRLSHNLELVRSAWLKFERFASAVRAAKVGIEASANIEPDAMREWNLYFEHVEETESRLHERIQWASHFVQDVATSLGQRQGQQISRLAIVSIFFLPISFLTGYFGMNFGWMAEQLGSRSAFLTFGMLLPLVCAGATVLWLKRRALL